jgi:ElaB/YqjD/DUF883 family membrane-anchored ribosome-binding protein
MTDLTPIDRRDALRARIEAAERRNAERSLADQARAAADAAMDYTRANPLTVIGGALTAGLVIGLLARPGRRVAGQALHGAGEAISGAASCTSSDAKSLAKRGGSRLASIIGKASLAYAMTMVEDWLETVREGQERAETEAKALSKKASKGADATRTPARKTAGAAVGAVRDLGRKAGG